MNWKPLSLITSFALTVTFAACTQSDSQNQIVDNVSSPEESSASPADTVSSTDSETQAEMATSETGTTSQSSTNKTGTTAKSKTSETISNNPCGKQDTVASQETANYRVFICGSKDGPKTYVGIAKKGGKSIKLPVKVDQNGNYVATNKGKNEDTIYQLTPDGELSVRVADDRVEAEVLTERKINKSDSERSTQTTSDNYSESNQAIPEPSPESNQTGSDTQPDNQIPPDSQLQNN